MDSSLTKHCNAHARISLINPTISMKGISLAPLAFSAALATTLAAPTTSFAKPAAKSKTTLDKGSFVIVNSCPANSQTTSSGYYQPCTYFYDSLTAMSKEKFGKKDKSWFKVKAQVSKAVEKDGYAPANQGMSFLNTLAGNSLIKDFAEQINSASKSQGINYVVSFYLLRSDVKFDYSYSMGFMGFGGGAKTTWTPIFDLEYTITNALNGKILDRGVLNGEKIVSQDKTTFGVFNFGNVKSGSNPDTTKLQMAIADSAAKQLIERIDEVSAEK